MKIRPLKRVSDFVVEELTEMLETPSKALVAHVEFLLQEFKHELTLADCITGAPDRDIALLDLKMLESGVVHSGLTPPKQLVELIDRLTPSGTVPALTYEELIFVNPLHDCRTFTRGDVGNTEKNFYVTHGLIEGSLGRVIAIVKDCILAGKAPWSGMRSVPLGPGRTCRDGTEYVQEELSEVLQKVTELSAMPPDHFVLFRKYLASHPLRNLKGPSGAFTASIPVLDLLLRGNDLPPNYPDYLRENMRYFPCDGQKEIQNAIHTVSANQTLVEIWRRRPNVVRKFSDPERDTQELKRMIDAIGEFLNAFRRAHMGAVARQIPEALKGNLAGTGGESNPGQFLRQRMEETRFRKERDER